MRKVIQLIQGQMGIFALCDDGQIFQYDSLNQEWREFKNVPQPGEETPVRRR